MQRQGGGIHTLGLGDCWACQAGTKGSWRCRAVSWERPSGPDQEGLDLCPVAQPGMWDDSSEVLQRGIGGGKIISRRKAPSRLKPEERPGLVPERLEELPSGHRISRPGRRAWTGSLPPSTGSESVVVPYPGCYCCSVAKSCRLFATPMDCSLPGLPVPYH